MMTDEGQKLFIGRKDSKMTSPINIVSYSGGKDSTAMLHMLLEQGVKIDKIICFECEWDFPQMNNHLKLVEKNTGLQIIRVRYYRHFNEQLAVYGWPKSAGGWCTACKHITCVKYIRFLKGDKTEYIGFSADEVHRTQTKWMKERKWPVKFPLIEAGMSETDSLAYCKNLGYDWDGLYDVFDRVSCFCCPKGGKAKREKIRLNYPVLWKRWLELDEIAERNTMREHQPTERQLRNAQAVMDRGGSLKAYAKEMMLSYWQLSRKLSEIRRRRVVG